MEGSVSKSIVPLPIRVPTLESAFEEKMVGQSCWLCHLFLSDQLGCKQHAAAESPIFDSQMHGMTTPQGRRLSPERRPVDIVSVVVSTEGWCLIR